MIDLNEAAKNLVKIPDDIAKDPLVKKICERMINRSNAGIVKYGNTMIDANIGLITGFLALYFMHPYQPDSASN